MDSKVIRDKNMPTREQSHSSDTKMKKKADDDVVVVRFVICAGRFLLEVDANLTTINK